MKESAILMLLDMQCQICHNSVQRDYINMIKQNTRIVKISSLKEFPDEIRELIYKALEVTKPVSRQCYKNAAYLTTTINPTLNVRYVEGYMSFHGIPIEHAFNVITFKEGGEEKTLYFDVTTELANNSLDEVEEYAVTWEFDYKTLFDMLIDSQTYMQFYPQVFRNIIENKRK